MKILKQNTFALVFQTNLPTGLWQNILVQAGC